MMPVGNMLWRIGRTLDIGRQIAWTREAGFDAVGLHASAGALGHWRGIEPTDCDSQQRAGLREQLADFAFVEIHAPFAIELRQDTLEAGIAALGPVLAFAHDLGAAIVTVHAQLARTRAERWLGPLRELDEMAGRAGALVALEIVDGFEAVAVWDLPHVGVNLDVGHMVLPPNRHLLTRYGGFRQLIQLVGSKLVHLHLHDVSGDVDHIEIGTGEVPFCEIISGLADIGYPHGATLEMNPDRVTPAGMKRSLQAIREFTGAGRSTA
jgi:sugar phosphate isomerase/epimerase